MCMYIDVSISLPFNINIWNEWAIKTSEKWIIQSDWSTFIALLLLFFYRNHNVLICFALLSVVHFPSLHSSYIALTPIHWVRERIFDQRTKFHLSKIRNQSIFVLRFLSYMLFHFTLFSQEMKINFIETPTPHRYWIHSCLYGTILRGVCSKCVILWILEYYLIENGYSSPRTLIVPITHEHIFFCHLVSSNMKTSKYRQAKKKNCVMRIRHPGIEFLDNLIYLNRDRGAKKKIVSLHVLHNKCIRLFRLDRWMDKYIYIRR